MMRFAPIRAAQPGAVEGGRRGTGTGLVARRSGAVIGAVLALAAAISLSWLAADHMRVVAPVLVLALFVATLWCGASVIAVAPLFALLLALLIEGDGALAFFESRFATSAGDFVARFFPVFLLGAIFGRTLVESGCAAGIARQALRVGRRSRAPLAVAGACALLTLGGVGVFVIAFAMQPIAREIYARARLPPSLVPAAIAFGAFTATMTAIPGAPSLTNIVAATMLGTDAFAAPLPGLLAASVMMLFGGWWLCRVADRAPPDETESILDAEAAPPPFALAVAPVAVTLVGNGVLSAWFAAQGPQGAYAASGSAFWAVVAALSLGIVVTACIGGAGALRRGVEAGAATAVGPLLATALGVGFGVSLAATPGAQALVGWLEAICGAGTAEFAAAATAFYAAAVGSSSGGIHLALTSHGEDILAVGRIDPPTLHRVAALASGVLDTLPHSGAVLALLAICRASHAQSYRDVFVVSVIGPALALAAVLCALRLPL